ncbi:MAG: hypothetical protein ACOY46_09835 [Bacillota bacterium]
MRKLPGGIFFVSAAVLLAVTKTPDIFTVLAVIACSAIAALSSTKHSPWAVIGGGAIIGLSLTLQAVLSYRCMDCIKADILIMAGVICLSIIERGKLKKQLRVLASVVTAIMILNIALHYPSIGLNKAEAVQEIVQHIKAVTPDGREEDLDTQERPVFYFLPSCGACDKVIEELIKKDPEGKAWAPVQAGGGLEEGREYLNKKGYRGDFYSQKWNGPVPAFITTRDGKTEKIHGRDAILTIVRGDSG